MITLSTHVLDTMHGRPAPGVQLWLENAAGDVLFAAETDADGRCSGFPALAPGRYALTFAVAEYFAGTGTGEALPDPPFLHDVRIAFGAAGDEAGEGHYHVPLLVSPFSYSTYRGS